MRRCPLPAALLAVLALAGQATALFAGFAGMTLREALEHLRAQGVRLIYSSQLVRPEMRVEREPAGTTRRQVLEGLLAPWGLRAVETTSGTLLIVPAPKAVPGGGTVRGRVSAQDTGLPLAGVELRLGKARGVAWTDRRGTFELARVPSGVYVLEAVLPGYAPATRAGLEVPNGTVLEVEIVLVPQPRLLQEVVVEPSRYGFLQSAPEPRQVVDRAQGRALPHLWDDAFRVAQRLPGVNAGDISSQLGVRGSSPDEVLVVLDGLQLHDPFHLRGLSRNFSIVDSELLDGVELSSGGFGVERGDRVGGVLELRTVIPERSRLELGASGISARVLAAGGGGEAQAAWLISVRRGYAEWVLRWLETIDEEPGQAIRPVFWDVYATWRRSMGEHVVTSAHVLAARDEEDLEDLDQRELLRGRTRSWSAWANFYASLTGGVTAHSVVSCTGDSREVDGWTEPSEVRATAVEDRRTFNTAGLTSDWVWEPGRGHLQRWGVEVKRVDAAYDLEASFRSFHPVFTGLTRPHVVTRSAHLRPEGWQLAAYGAERLRLGTGLVVEVGARWDRQSWAPGEAQLSPRLNLVWELGEAGTLRAAWGRFAQSQGVAELAVEDGESAFHRAQWTEQSVLSFEHLTASGALLRVEAYQKAMRNLRPRYVKVMAINDLFPAGEADRVQVAADRGRAHGIELLLKGRRGRPWTWWVSGAIASVEDRVGGAWVPRSWDQRRAFGAAVNWQAGPGWDLALALAYHSGWPTTPFAWVAGPSGGVYRLGDRNTARLPSFSRVDLRVSRQLAFARSRLRLFLEIANLTDHDNLRLRQGVQYTDDGSGVAGQSSGDEKWMPILPILGFSWEL